MEMTDAKVVEKKIYEEGKKHDDYASKATGNAGLTLGIIGTALGAGAWLLGCLAVTTAAYLVHSAAICLRT